MKFNFSQLDPLEMLKGINVRHLHLEGHHCKGFRYDTSLKILTRSDQRNWQPQVTVFKLSSIRPQSLSRLALLISDLPVEESITADFLYWYRKMHIKFLQDVVFAMMVFFLFFLVVLIYFLAGSSLNTYSLVSIYKCK